MIDDSNRIDALDFLRGLAVMGILLANMVAFGLPSAAQLNPFALGRAEPLDLAAWLFNFLLVDGKFRALFALMFGASMLLVMESAEIAGRDGLLAHRRRMAWLLVIGLAHHILLWSGDILVPLAIGGLIATAFVRMETLTLVKWALALLAAQWAIDLIAVLPPFWLRSAALAPEAGADLLARWHNLADALGGPGSAAVNGEIALYRSGYATLVAARLSALGQDMANMLLFTLPELIAFMALGMAMLKGGFLSAQWAGAQYRETWRRSLLVGLLPMIGLGVWVLLSRDPLAAEASAFAWSLPLRLPLAAAYAALAMDVAVRWPETSVMAPIRAVGRLALSNYLLTSLLMTALFYGYGVGLYARLDRAALSLIAVAAWGAMLIWSALWRRRFHQGPAEWLWRRVARGRV